MREDAPKPLRMFILKMVRELDTFLLDLPDILYADTAFRHPPPTFGFDTGMAWFQLLEKHLLSCEWFRVYDFLERFAAKNMHWILTEKPKALYFTRSVNQYFCDNGIGWRLVGEEVIARGDDAFQEAVATAASRLRETERPTAANHIRSAVRALSERPKANTPGAVAHGTSAVECLLNNISGEAMSLGKYLDKHPGLFHPAVKKALDGGVRICFRCRGETRERRNRTGIC